MPHRLSWLHVIGLILLTLGALIIGPLLLILFGPPLHAAPGWEGRVPDVCDGAPAGHDACSMWISSLWSEYGRCCETADAIDALWQPSRTAESGYAVNYDGQWYDVDAKAAHMQQSVTDANGNFHLDPVTGNKAGKTLLWLNFTLDDNSVVFEPPQPGTHKVTAIAVRCYEPGGGF